MNSRLDAEILHRVTELAAEAGGCGPVSVQPVAGGRNNRVFHVQAGPREYILKQYFVSAEDPRDRLHHEFSFVKFAWDRGIRCVPEPMALDQRHRIGLYERIHGRVASSRPASEGDIMQAADFLGALHRQRRHPAAGHLPWAAESAASVKGHIDNVQRRIDRLSLLSGESDLDRQARQIAQSELLPLWSRVRTVLYDELIGSGRGDETLDREQLWLSPSDFGFHNAMEEPGGRLRFLDFEFAGWDDPAKLLCDFIYQPDQPLPVDLAATFLREIARYDVNPDSLRRRFRLLTPLCHVKWGCIILNDFLPFGQVRQQFTGHGCSPARKQAQLEKLRAVLARGRHGLERGQEAGDRYAAPEPRASYVVGGA